MKLCVPFAKKFCFFYRKLYQVSFIPHPLGSDFKESDPLPSKNPLPQNSSQTQNSGGSSAGKKKGGGGYVPPHARKRGGGTSDFQRKLRDRGNAGGGGGGGVVQRQRYIPGIGMQPNV